MTLDSAAGVLVICIAFILSTVSGFALLLYMARRGVASAASGTARMGAALGTVDGVPSLGPQPASATQSPRRVAQSDGTPSSRGAR